MATNYRNSAGTDFDDLFDPYVTGTVPPNTAFRTSDGVDLAGRYAPLSYGTKRADVNYRTSAGLDLSNLWAQKGSAIYFPANIASNSTTTSGVARSANITFTVKTDGTMAVGTVGTTNSFGSGIYRFAADSTAYDFRMFSTALFGQRASPASSATVTGKGGVSLAYPNTPGSTLTFDTGWVTAAADDANAFLTLACASAANAGYSGIGSASGSARSVTFQVRRKSDSVVVTTWTTNVDCLADSQS